ncbi:MAG: GNAT family N-acetyltransferase [Candidatus Marsarchaeota archaeon]|nr:GNAT family N-acetyltransferase [Candidatus Marsarchaeota archaeon]
MILKSGEVLSAFERNGLSIGIRTPKKSDVFDLRKMINDLVEEQAMILKNNKATIKEEAKFLRNTLAEIMKGNRIMLVAEVNGRVVGNCELKIHSMRERHVGSIGIAISKKYRSIGIGKVLMKNVIELAKKTGIKLIYLEVLDINDCAIHVYKSLGFKRAGKIPGKILYKNRYHDSIMMVKKI